ncbi:YjaG family protein [Oceanospirillum sediminis]|uniref:YjaG family protein n=1 Tax=Oceanospirillum sediminis TaxID=2760088 RepID=A0A839IMN1_9GAMM|nr:YjaG family protein [Oceanospirillum sediminis]MBB1486683.1 YjaG family protein [Oceanospirillum sediminis]
MSNFFQQLKALQPWQQTAFAAAMAERMLPNYALFCQVVDDREAQPLKNALMLVWEFLSSKDSKINFEVQLEKVAEQIPDAASYPMYGVYPAIDAAMAVHTTMELAMGTQAEEVTRISRLMRQTIIRFVEATEDLPEDEALRRKALNDHELMQFDHVFQDEVLVQLQDMKAYDKNGLKALRLMAQNDGVSCLGLSAEEVD